MNDLSPTSPAGRVLVERPEPGIAVIRIDRPDRRNALNMAVKRALTTAIAAAVKDNAIKVVILTGGDRFFVAGTDIAEMRDMSPASHRALESGAVFEVLRACPKPVIAAVEGYALGGGCELALACDMIVAGSGARFGQPEIKVGIIPGAGGTQMLVRAAGRHRAMKLLLTGDPFTANEAFAMGLVSDVVADGTALNAAMTLARTILGMPPLAVHAIKDAVRQGMDAPLTTALAYERRLFEQLFASDDQVEGMQAFLDKRSPDYKGR